MPQVPAVYIPLAGDLELLTKMHKLRALSDAIVHLREAQSKRPSREQAVQLQDLIQQRIALRNTMPLRLI
jgi:hypothetical protein